MRASAAVNLIVSIARLTSIRLSLIHFPDSSVITAAKSSSLAVKIEANLSKTAILSYSGIPLLKAFSARTQAWFTSSSPHFATSAMSSAVYGSKTLTFSAFGNNFSFVTTALRARKRSSLEMLTCLPPLVQMLFENYS